MKVVLSDQVVEALKDVPAPVLRSFGKQLRFLAGNLHRPSLRAKKYDESKDHWQARGSGKIVNDNFKPPAVKLKSPCTL